MGRVLKLQTAAVGLVVRAILLLLGGLILATFLVSRFFIVTRRRVGAREMPAAWRKWRRMWQDKLSQSGQPNVGWRSTACAKWSECTQKAHVF